MKKIFVWLGMSIVAAFAFPGCLKQNDNDQPNPNSPIIPGLSIYSAASSQNAISLQPADAVLRLAMLRSEAQAQGKLDKLDQVEVEGSGNVKSLLFGANTKITKSDNVYEIAYAQSSGLDIFDPYVRLGNIRIDTGGKSLEQTDELNPWKISLGSPKLEIQGGGKAYVVTSTGDMKIYRLDNKFIISFSNSVSYISDSRIADWTGNFKWTPYDADNLSFSILKGKEYGFSGEGIGRSFWTTDGKSSLNLSYQLQDGKYKPSEIKALLLVSGVEVCRLTNPSDYSSVDYPSAVVKLTWTFKDMRLYYKVEYNGYTMDIAY